MVCDVIVDDNDVVRVRLGWVLTEKRDANSR